MKWHPWTIPFSFSHFLLHRYANEGPLQPLSSSITTPMHQVTLCSRYKTLLLHTSALIWSVRTKGVVSNRSLLGQGWKSAHNSMSSLLPRKLERERERKKTLRVIYVTLLCNVHAFGINQKYRRLRFSFHADAFRFHFWDFIYYWTPDVLIKLYKTTNHEYCARGNEK